MSRPVPSTSMKGLMGFGGACTRPSMYMIRSPWRGTGTPLYESAMKVLRYENGNYKCIRCQASGVRFLRFRSSVFHLVLELYCLRGYNRAMLRAWVSAFLLLLTAHVRAQEVWGVGNGALLAAATSEHQFWDLKTLLL